MSTMDIRDATLKIGEQRTVGAGEQVSVVCQACGLKQHVRPVDVSDPGSVICTGPQCEHTFSVKEGIKHAIASDDDFMAWCFISDTMIYGADVVTIGMTKTITLETPVKAVKKVFLSHVGDALAPGSGEEIYLEHKFSAPDRLIIISSGPEAAVGSPVEVAWTLYANVGSDDDGSWREYLQRAKESLINQEFQDAIIQAEIAVEVTLESIVWELLIKKKRVSHDVADWILNHFKSVSDRAKHVMELAIGKKVSDIDPVIYKSWVNSVAMKRNRIVHQGEPATKDEAEAAIGAAFEMVWLLLELADKKPLKVQGA